jgi:hypothetical protein
MSISKADYYQDIIEYNLKFMMSFLEEGEYLTRPTKKICADQIEESFRGLLIGNTIKMTQFYSINLVCRALKVLDEKNIINLQSKRKIDRREKNKTAKVIGKGNNFDQMPSADKVNSFLVLDKTTVELSQFMHKMYKIGMIQRCKSKQEKNRFEVVFSNQKNLEPMLLTRSKLFDFLNENLADGFRVNIIDTIENNMPENKLEIEKIGWQNEEGETHNFTKNEIVMIIRGESLPSEEKITTPPFIDKNPARDLTIEEVESNLDIYKNKFFEELIAGSKQILEKLK